MKTLFIDTTNNKEVIVRLAIDKKIFEVKKEIQNNRTQVVLPIIQALFKYANLGVQDLDSVEINPGPGSFTGVRVGAAIGNALGFALDIPVNTVSFKESGKVVELQYS